MVLSILKYPDARLRKKSILLDLNQSNNDLRKLVDQMHETITQHKGAGLSAPQVAVAVRLVVIPEHISHDHTVFINPTVVGIPDDIQGANEMETIEEGCLSFPDIFINVTRPLGVVVNAFNLKGKQFTVRTLGTYARALRHEIEHLDGKLLIDHAGRVQRDIIKRKMKKWAKLKK